MRKIFFVIVFLLCSVNVFAQMQKGNRYNNLNFIKNSIKYQTENNPLPEIKEKKHSALNLMEQNFAGITGGFLLALPIYSLATSDDFCNTAFQKGWLREFVKKYKYMYHCPEYHGDPCWCQDNNTGWELEWIQYIGVYQIYS